MAGKNKPSHFKFRLRNHRFYPWLFVGLCLVLGAITVCLSRWKIIHDDKLFEATISVLGVAVGFTHFLYLRHLDQTKFFHDLAVEFNTRYDKVNEVLNEIRDAGDMVDKSEAGKRQKQLDYLYDYFNLCAEEHLYYNAGFIDQHVWISWCVGMKDFADVPGIKEVWAKELKRPSYYGFNLEEVIGMAEKAIKDHKSNYENKPVETTDRSDYEESSSV